MEKPAHFSPGDEPYIGRQPLHVFDVLISSAIKLSSVLASKTRTKRLSELQRAAAQVVPQGLNIAFSIREIIRQAHLFPALVLVRSLVERSAIISYVRRHSDALPLWERGWKHGERRSLVKMLADADPINDMESARKVCDTLNHLVHGDPYKDVV